MKTPKKNSQTMTIALDPKPKGEFKILGGSRSDDWNMRLVNLVAGALPIEQSNSEAEQHGISAVFSGNDRHRSGGPNRGNTGRAIDGGERSGATMYRKGWAQPPEYFEARTKYLALADKASRTVTMLTERLDHHRGRGQQQITVKHVTTNNVTADQAIIADSVTTGGGARNVASPALLAASSETPMPILDEIRRPDPVGVGGGTKSK